MKLTGIVLWWDCLAGEGAILRPRTGYSYYVHYSDICGAIAFEKASKARLARGQPVLFLEHRNLLLPKIYSIEPLVISSTDESEDRIDTLVDDFINTGATFDDVHVCYDFFYEVIE